MRRAVSFEKTLMLGKIGGRRRRGWQDEMVGWHHWLKGHGFGWTPGVGDEQGGLACYDSWDRKELDATEQLNWLNWNRNELWSHAKTSRKFKRTLLSEKSIWKAYRVHNSNYMTSWKWQNQGDSKKIHDCRRVEGWTGTAQRTFRAMWTLYMTLYWWIHLIYTSPSNLGHQESTTR